MEFSPSDPPPSSFVQVSNYAPAGYYAPPVNYAPVASYTAVYDTQPVVPSYNHPSYQEMISSAILALNEKGGSSRQAIVKYIENHFKIAPSQAHNYELTQQLKRMKNCGQLVLNKHSYMFPGSLTAVTVTSQISDAQKRRPGRPPKLQPNGGLLGSSGTAVAVGFENKQVGEAGFGVPTANLFDGLKPCEFHYGGGNVNNVVTAPVSNVVTAPVSNGVPVPMPVSNVVPVPLPVPLPVPVSNTPTMVYNGGAMYDAGAVANVVPIEQTDVVSAKRGRGRPRKVNTSAVGVESGAIIVSPGKDAAAKNNVANGPPAVTPPTVLGKRRRGRPAKLDMMVTVPVVNGGAKEGQGGLAMVPGEVKRGRGRPRNNVVGAIVAANGAGGGGVLPVAKKPRKVSDKPLGRPRKNAAHTASLMSELQMLAYEGLKARVEHYQSRIKTAISVVKPYLNETAVIALGALQDLEELANMDIISVPSVQGALVDVQSAPVNVQSAPVDLNAPVNVLGTSPENIQSEPLTAEAASLAFQSAQSTGETTQSTFVQGQ